MRTSPVGWLARHLGNSLPLPATPLHARACVRAHTPTHTCAQQAHTHTNKHVHLPAGRLLRHLGITLSLTAMPIACAVGILAVGAQPSTHTVAMAEVLRKVVGYSMVRPAREVRDSPQARGPPYAREHGVALLTMHFSAPRRCVQRITKATLRPFILLSGAVLASNSR